MRDSLSVGRLQRLLAVGRARCRKRQIRSSEVPTESMRERQSHNGYGLPIVGPSTLSMRGIRSSTGGSGLRSLCEPC
jgi:hypothetical protein